MVLRAKLEVSEFVGGADEGVDDPRFAVAVARPAHHLTPHQLEERKQKRVKFSEESGIGDVGSNLGQDA